MFFPENLNFTKCNYEIYNKKLFTIIYYYEQWKSEFKDIKIPIKVIIDHKSLKYLITTKKLTKRQIY